MWRNKSIPLIGGMTAETLASMSVGQSQQQATPLSRIINGAINNYGEVTKREGYSAMSLTIHDNFTAARTLVNADGAGNDYIGRSLISVSGRHNEASNDTLYALASGFLLKFSAGLGAWIPTDSFKNGAIDEVHLPTGAGCSTQYKLVERPGRDHHATQTATNGSVTVIAWIEIEGSYGTDASPRLFYSIYDNTNGTFIFDGKDHSPGVDIQQVMAVSVGGSVGFVYIEGNDLKLTDVSNPASIVTSTLKTDAYNTSPYAPLYAAAAPDGAKVMIAYRQTGGGNTVTVFFATFAGVVSSTTSYATAAVVRCCAVEYDSVSNKCVVAAGYVFGAAPVTRTIVTSATLVDQALNVDHGPGGTTEPVRIAIGFAQVLFGGLASSNGTVFLATQYAEVNPGDGGTTIIVGRVVSTAAGFYSVGGIRYRTNIMGTFFTAANMLYLPVAFESALQSTLFIIAVGVEFNSRCIAGKSAPGISGGDMDNRAVNFYAPPCRVTPLSDYKFITGNTVKTNYVQGPLVGRQLAFTQSCFVTLDFKSPVSSTTVNDITYIAAGSVLKQIQGTKCVEAGFLISPEMGATNVSMAGAAGLLSTGDYSYRFYYERVSGGIRTRSYAFSFTKTAAATNTATISVPNLLYTQADDVIIVGYRTAVNPTASSPYYRVTSLGPGRGGATGSEGCGWYLNDPFIRYTTVTDGIADVFLLLETDYLYAGEVGHVLPDSQQYVVQHGNRLVTASSSTIQPSQLMTPRYSVEFSDTVETAAPRDGSNITGLFSLGSYLAIFRKNSISIVSGDGPDNTGVGQYSDEHTISHSVGAHSQATLCRVPGGVAFAGEAGMYVLEESLNLKFIGQTIFEQVEADTSVIGSVVYNSLESYIAFGSPSTVYTYVFYVLYGVWSVYACDQQGLCNVVYNGKLTTYFSTNTMAQLGAALEDSIYLPDATTSTTQYNFDMVFGYYDITGGDHGSHSRIKSIILVGRHTGAGTYSIDVSYDDANSYSDTDGGSFEDSKSYNTVTAVTGWTATQSRFRHFLLRQKCSTIQIRIRQTDNQSGGAWTHIILEVKESANLAKVSPRNSG